MVLFAFPFFPVCEKLNNFGLGTVKSEKVKTEKKTKKCSENFISIKSGLP